MSLSELSAPPDRDGGGAVHAGADAKVGRTVEAVIVDWSAVERSSLPRTRAAVKAALRAVSLLGCHVAVCLSDRAVRLPFPGREPSRTARTWLISAQLGLVEVGRQTLRIPGESEVRPDAVSALMATLAEIGVTGDLVMDLRETPVDEVLSLLNEQTRRRRWGRAPSIDEDPEWVVREPDGSAERNRLSEALMTIASGGVGTRATLECDPAGAVLCDGVYTGVGPAQHLLTGPGWTGLRIQDPQSSERILDLRTGVFVHRESVTDGINSLRFASIRRPGVMVLRADGPRDRLDCGRPLTAPAGALSERGHRGHQLWMRATGVENSAICAVAEQRTHSHEGLRVVDRLVSFDVGTPPHGTVTEAGALLEGARMQGIDALLAEQRAAWADRWAAVDVRIPGDPDAQLAVRFALFHLWSAVTGRRETAVGARGLTGPGYSGHVFWDADVFVLPALLSMEPRGARAMLQYRRHRLPAARARAHAAGATGARFPWESAASGADVTPPSGRTAAGRVQILTGELEEHITADVAWAAVRYASWTGRDVARDPVTRELLRGAASYWASRAQVGPDGEVHILDVIGPDEYHEHVDDNAFTNVMVRWVLRAAAGAGDEHFATAHERAAWSDLADRIVDGYDPVTKVYEQFAGYHALTPVPEGPVPRRPFAADLLLGHDTLAASQWIKQPDVLMLHHLVPRAVARNSLAANLDHYGPRTAHGSSLSPAITASLLARAGRPDEALEMLRIALRIDLDDMNGTSGAGLHLATMGGVWQAMLAGFAGVEVTGSVLHLDPRLPAAWPELELRFRVLGAQVRLVMDPERVQIHADRPLSVQLRDAPVRRISGWTVLT